MIRNEKNIYRFGETKTPSQTLNVQPIASCGTIFLAKYISVQLNSSAKIYSRLLHLTQYVRFNTYLSNLIVLLKLDLRCFNTFPDQQFISVCLFIMYVFKECQKSMQFHDYSLKRIHMKKQCIIKIKC